MEEEYYKSANYINDIGLSKIIKYRKNDDDQYSFAIFSAINGECCGSGTFSKEDITKFFNHYGISLEGIE